MMPIQCVHSLCLLLATLRAEPAEPPLAETAATSEPEPTGHETVRALVQAAGASEDNDGADAVLVLDQTDVRVEESGLAHYRRKRLFKVLTEAGATRLATLRFDYDPASNTVRMERARIHPAPENENENEDEDEDEDDKAATPIDLGQEHIRDLPQPQRRIYWGPRMKVLSVPRLAVGDALEVETYTKGFIIAYLNTPGSSQGQRGEAEASTDNAEEDDSRFIPPMRGHFYDLVLFGDASVPTLERRYAVTLPKSKHLQFEVYNGEVYSAVTFDNESTTYTFWKKKLKAHKHEPHAADKSDYLPKVVMATVADWEAKSRWFFEVNEGQFAANDAIRRKLTEILKGAKDDDDKISRILHWTAQEIRYSGISMGKGEGYTLHSGEMTFNDRAGVCKDIAGMSITLLRAAGFTSYAAMTMAGARVERIPADQFNHCVVAVKRPEGYRMIDPTWAPFSSELWSSAEREQHYVIGTPEGETLMRTPYLPPEHNRLNIVAQSRIAKNGDLTSDVAIDASGYVEDRLRRQVAYRSVDELRPSLEVMLARVASPVVLEELRFSDHRNLHKPFAVTLRYHIPGYAAVANNAMRTGIPTSRHLLGGRNFADWLLATESDERTSAIWLRSPQLVTFREDIQIPPGFMLVGQPIDEELKTAQGSMRASLHQVNDRLRFAQTIRIAQRNIAPDAYGDLKKIVDAVRTLGKRSVYLERSGGAK